MRYKKGGGIYKLLKRKCNQYNIDYSHIGKTAVKLPAPIECIKK